MSDEEELFLSTPVDAPAPRSRLRRLGKSSASSSTRGSSLNAGNKPRILSELRNDSDSDEPILPVHLPSKGRKLAPGSRKRSTQREEKDRASSDEEMVDVAPKESRAERGARRASSRPAASLSRASSGESDSESDGAAESSQSALSSDDSGSDISLGKKKRGGKRAGGDKVGGDRKQRTPKVAKHSILSESDEEHGGADHAKPRPAVLASLSSRFSDTKGVDTKVLRAKDFLVVGSMGKRSSWKLPYRELSGKINVHLLARARKALHAHAEGVKCLAFHVDKELNARVEQHWREAKQWHRWCRSDAGLPAATQRPIATRKSTPSHKPPSAVAKTTAPVGSSVRNAGSDSESSDAPIGLAVAKSAPSSGKGVASDGSSDSDSNAPVGATASKSFRKRAKSAGTVVFGAMADDSESDDADWLEGVEKQKGAGSESEDLLDAAAAAESRRQHKASKFPRTNSSLSEREDSQSAKARGGTAAGWADEEEEYLELYEAHREKEKAKDRFWRRDADFINDDEESGEEGDRGNSDAESVYGFGEECLEAGQRAPSGASSFLHVGEMNESELARLESETQRLLREDRSKLKGHREKALCLQSVLKSIQNRAVELSVERAAAATVGAAGLGTTAVEEQDAYDAEDAVDAEDAAPAQKGSTVERFSCTHCRKCLTAKDTPVRDPSARTLVFCSILCFRMRSDMASAGKAAKAASTGTAANIAGAAAAGLAADDLANPQRRPGQAQAGAGSGGDGNSDDDDDLMVLPSGATPKAERSKIALHKMMGGGDEASAAPRGARGSLLKKLRGSAATVRRADAFASGRFMQVSEMSVEAEWLGSGGGFDTQELEEDELPSEDEEAEAEAEAVSEEDVVASCAPAMGGSVGGNVTASKPAFSTQDEADERDEAELVFLQAKGAASREAAATGEDGADEAMVSEQATRSPMPPGQSDDTAPSDAAKTPAADSASSKEGSKATANSSSSEAAAITDAGTTRIFGKIFSRKPQQSKLGFIRLTSASSDAAQSMPMSVDEALAAADAEVDAKAARAASALGQTAAVAGAPEDRDDTLATASVDGALLGVKRRAEADDTGRTEATDAECCGGSKRAQHSSCNSDEASMVKHTDEASADNDDEDELLLRAVKRRMERKVGDAAEQPRVAALVDEEAAEADEDEVGSDYQEDAAEEEAAEEMEEEKEEDDVHSEGGDSIDSFIAEDEEEEEDIIANAVAEVEGAGALGEEDVFDDESLRIKERIRQKLGAAWVVGDRSAPSLDLSPIKNVDKDELRRELKRKRERGAHAIRAVFRSDSSSLPGTGEPSTSSVAGATTGSKGGPTRLWSRVAAAVSTSSISSTKCTSSAGAPTSTTATAAAAVRPAVPGIVRLDSRSMSGFSGWAGAGSDSLSSGGAAAASLPLGPRRANSFANSGKAGPGRAALLRDLGSTTSGGGTFSKGFVFRDDKSSHAANNADEGDRLLKGRSAGAPKATGGARPSLQVARSARGGGPAGGGLLAKILGKTT